MTVRLVTLATVLLASACARSAVTGGSSLTTQMTRGYDAQVASGFERVRAATKSFVSIDSAVAAGYPRTVAACIKHTEHGTHGAMGYHHINRTIVDTVLEIEKPEILLYEKRGDGTYRLNGVEYIVPYRLWSRDRQPPKLMGLDLKREDNLNLWYLHMWAWTENPAGLFADYNPAVACPQA